MAATTTTAIHGFVTGQRRQFASLPGMVYTAVSQSLMSRSAIAALRAARPAGASSLCEAKRREAA